MLAVSLKKNDTNKMNKEIISKIIGRLKQEESFPDWWKSEEVVMYPPDQIHLAYPFDLGEFY